MAVGVSDQVVAVVVEVRVEVVVFWGLVGSWVGFGGGRGSIL